MIVKGMIDSYGEINEKIFSLLLDTYTSKNWHMPLKDFIALAELEIRDYLQDLVDNADVLFGEEEEYEEE